MAGPPPIVPAHAIRPTLEEIEAELARLDELIARGETAAPDPHALAQLEKEIKEKTTEVDQKQEARRAEKTRELEGQKKAKTPEEKAEIAKGKREFNEALDKEKTEIISKLPARQVLDATKNLPLLRSKVEILRAAYRCPQGQMPHGGPCPICNQNHQVRRDDEAIEAAKQLWSTVKHNPRAAGLSPEMADVVQKEGCMVGVLLVKDAEGKIHTLRAFSKNLDVDPATQLESSFWCATVPVTTLHAPNGQMKPITERRDGASDKVVSDPPKLDSVVGQCAAPRMLDYVATFPQSAHKALEETYLYAARQAIVRVGLKTPALDDPAKIAPALEQAAAALEDARKNAAALAKAYTKVSDAEGAYVQCVARKDKKDDQAEAMELKAEVNWLGPAVLNLPGVQNQLQQLRTLLDKQPKKTGPTKGEFNKWSTASANAFEAFMNQIGPALDTEKARILDLPHKLQQAKDRLPKKLDRDSMKMAEIWVGGPAPESWPPKVDGDIYDSCLTCHSILGYTLCTSEKH